VNINDKIKKISTLIQGVSGTMMTGGEVVQKPELLSFYQLNVKHMQTFAVVSQESSMGEP